MHTLSVVTPTRPRPCELNTYSCLGTLVCVHACFLQLLKLGICRLSLHGWSGWHRIISTSRQSLSQPSVTEMHSGRRPGVL